MIEQDLVWFGVSRNRSAFFFAPKKTIVSALSSLGILLLAFYLSDRGPFKKVVRVGGWIEAKLQVGEPPIEATNTGSSLMAVPRSSPAPSRSISVTTSIDR